MSRPTVVSLGIRWLTSITFPRIMSFGLQTSPIKRSNLGLELEMCSMPVNGGCSLCPSTTMMLMMAIFSWTFSTTPMIVDPSSGTIGGPAEVFTETMCRLESTAANPVWDEYTVPSTSTVPRPGMNSSTTPSFTPGTTNCPSSFFIMAVLVTFSGTVLFRFPDSYTLVLRRDNVALKMKKTNNKESENQRRSRLLEESTTRQLQSLRHVRTKRRRTVDNTGQDATVRHTVGSK